MLISLLAAIGFTLVAEASNITPADCSQQNVQAAIDSAKSGDTVSVPSGNCIWTSTVIIGNKKLNMKGAGIGQTTITDQGSGGAALIVHGASKTNFVDISGFTFIKGANHAWGIIQISGTVFEVGFRFHHNRILHGASGVSRGISTSTVYGLIDNNVFDVAATSGSIQMTSIYGDDDSTQGGYVAWKQPLSMGSANAVYIEDNQYNYGSTDEDCIDGYSGSRIVIRHNTFTNSHIGFHGTDSGPRRSALLFEIYNNTFTNNSSKTFEAARIRGGTGVIYSNTYGGSHGIWYDIAIMNYRSCVGSSYWQTCNGTDWKLTSTDISSDGSRNATSGGSVKFCSGDRETLCSSDSGCTGNGTCSTYLDTDNASGYACRDQSGVGPGQVSVPIYAWSNGSRVMYAEEGGGPSGCLNNYVVSGRDFINNGSTPKPGYTAFIYPHPLAISLAPPQNLKIID